jgi:hypothetical protein
MRLTKLVTAAAVIAMAAMLVAPGSAFAVRKLALSNGSFKFSGAAGDTINGSIVVVNAGDEPIKVLVYSADQNVDGQGRLSFTVPSRADFSSTNLPSAWVRVNMPQNSQSVGNIPFIALTPKQRVPIDFSIKIPADVPPGDHNVMLFFEMFSGEGLGKGAGAEISGRIGTRVQLRVKGSVIERLEMSRFAVPAFVIGQDVSTDFTVHDLGNTDQRVVANVRLLDRNDDAVTQIRPINNVLVFAGKNLESSGTLAPGKQLIGQYTASVEVVPVDENGQPVASAAQNTVLEKKTVWILPLWLVVTIGALLALLFLWIIWSAGRRSALRRHQKDAAKQAAAAVAAPDDGNAQSA